MRTLPLVLIVPQLADWGVYRQKAAAMRAQAQRAETPYLKAVYDFKAENWDRLATEMESGTRQMQNTRRGH